jgi:protein-S-isoprenylcysteine O-methyltransferase Ste14
MRRSRIPDLGPNGEGWVVGQVALILAIAALGALAVPHAFDGASGFVRALQIIAGAVLMLTGALVVWIGIGDLGPSLTPTPRPRSDGQLVVQGIYARIRHPIYAGIIELAIGWAGVTGSGLALVLSLILAVWLDLKSRREEAWLIERYPEYAAYRERTPRFRPRFR